MVDFVTTATGGQVLEVNLFEVLVDNVCVVVTLLMSADLAVSILHRGERDSACAKRASSLFVGRSACQLVQAVVFIVIHRLVMNKDVRLKGKMNSSLQSK